MEYGEKKAYKMIIDIVHGRKGAFATELIDQIGDISLVYPAVEELVEIGALEKTFKPSSVIDKKEVYYSLKRMEVNPKLIEVYAKMISFVASKGGEARIEDIIKLVPEPNGIIYMKDLDKMGIWKEGAQIDKKKDLAHMTRVLNMFTKPPEIAEQPKGTPADFFNRMGEECQPKEKSNTPLQKRDGEY